MLKERLVEIKKRKCKTYLEKQDNWTRTKKWNEIRFTVMQPQHRLKSRHTNVALYEARHSKGSTVKIPRVIAKWCLWWQVGQILSITAPFETNYGWGRSVVLVVAVVKRATLPTGCEWAWVWNSARKDKPKCSRKKKWLCSTWKGKTVKAIVDGLLFCITRL